MNWFYAVGGQQQGPIDDAQLDTLIQSGQVTQDSLVWHEGLANWQPLRLARPSGASGSAPPAQNPAAPPIVGQPAASGQVLCAECAKSFSREDTIQYGTAWVCAACKPIFLQKLREGSAPGASPLGQPGAPFDPDAFLTAVRERDYAIDIGSCLSRGWELVKENLWISIGVVTLVYVCLMAATFVPCVGGIVQLVINGPLMGGLYWFFLRLIRGQDAAVGDAFAGFSMGFMQLFLVSLVSGLLAGLCMLPGIITLIAGSAMKSNIPIPIIVVAFAVGVIPAVYLSICWIFSLPLTIDKRLEFWPAMELSRKVVSMHWGSVFVFLLVCGLVSLLGVLALCVGILVAAPVVMAAVAYAYEDIFSGGAASKPD